MLAIGNYVGLTVVPTSITEQPPAVSGDVMLKPAETNTAEDQGNQSSEVQFAGHVIGQGGDEEGL